MRPCCLSGLLALLAFSRLADCGIRTVGMGTSDSCTEAALDAQLNLLQPQDELIFECGPDATTIHISFFKWISQPGVTLNGGGKIILDAGHQTRHFVILFPNNGGGSGNNNGQGPNQDGDSDVDVVTLRGLTLRGGRAGDPDTWVRPGLQRDNRNEQIFADLRRKRDGGAIYVGRRVHLLLDGVTIENCETSAEQDDPEIQSLSLNGGALYLSSLTETVIENCVFSDNRAQHEGGAIMATSGAETLFVVNTLFLRNVALADVASGGGALYIERVQFSCERCTFRENRARLGGAIRSSDASLQLNECVFSKNRGGRDAGDGSLGAPGRGGAMYVTELGGSGRARIGMLDISHSSFEDNEAAESGGGLYLCLDKWDAGTITYTSFCANKIRPTVAQPYTGAALQRDCAGVLTLANVTMGGNVVTSADDAASSTTQATFHDVVGNTKIQDSDIPGLSASSGDVVDPPGDACPSRFCLMYPDYCVAEEEETESEEEEEEEPNEEKTEEEEEEEEEVEEEIEEEEQEEEEKKEKSTDCE